jgi:hypothetical protein
MRTPSKLLRIVASGMLATVLMQTATAQQVEQDVAAASEWIAISFSPDSSSELDFVGTPAAPGASGEVDVKISDEKTVIRGKFQKLPEPSALGPFAVYILWVVTPGGRAINIGMLTKDGDHGKIEAETPLSSFALIVTAEPHFAVSVPSKIVVMENIGKNAKGNSLPVTSLAVREDYTSLKKVVIDKKHPIPLDLEMARYAVAAAETAGAKEFATAAFDRARGALASAEAEFTSKKSAERQRVEEDSREAIQAGEDARAGAEVRRNSLKYIAQADLIKERDKTIADEQAKSAHLQADLDSARQKLAALQKLLPSASTRVALAGDVLSKWFTVPPPTDAGLTVHVPENMFLKGTKELLPDMKQRLSLATGTLLGIGGLSVSVSPSVQGGDDVQKLAMSQQRARAVMEWLLSMGVSSVMGTASPDADASMAMGPGVDLLVAGSGS